MIVNSFKINLIIGIILTLILFQGAMAFSFSSNQIVNTGSSYSSSSGMSYSSSGISQNIQSTSVTTVASSPAQNTAGEETKSFTASETEASDPDLGDLWVKSSPEGADVFIGEFQQPNTTPLLITLLNPGEYLLTVKIEGYEPYNEKITISKGKVHTIVANFDGKWQKEVIDQQKMENEESKEDSSWSEIK